MLIAPLFEPIMALALSVVMGRIGQLKKASLTLGRVILGVVTLAIIVSLFSPFRDIPGQEILSRTNPNLIHLAIALVSGITGALAMIWPRLSSSMVGVLIAAALLPPLAVVGHSLVAFDLIAASGAFILFLANLVALIFTGTIMLLIFGFRPDHQDSKKDMILLQTEIRWSVILMILLAIPLTYSLVKVVQSNQQEQKVRQLVLDSIPSLNESDIDSISVSRQSESIQVKVSITSSQIIDETALKMVGDQLGNSFDNHVILDVTLLPVVRYVR